MIGSLLQIHPAVNSASDYIPIVMQLVISLFVVGLLIILAFRFKSRKNTIGPEANSEGDAESNENEGTAETLKYFMITALFVLFLTAVMVLFPYAVDMRVIGWNGFAAVTLFVSFLLSGLIYAIRKENK